MKNAGSLGPALNARAHDYAQARAYRHPCQAPTHAHHNGAPRGEEGDKEGGGERETDSPLGAASEVDGRGSGAATAPNLDMASRGTDSLVSCSRRTVSCSSLSNCSAVNLPVLALPFRYRGIYSLVYPVMFCHGILWMCNTDWKEANY